MLVAYRLTLNKDLLTYLLIYTAKPRSSLESTFAVDDSRDLLIYI